MQRASAATKNIYKEVADRAAGLSPSTNKTIICTTNDASCYDHTNNTGIGEIRVSRAYPSTDKAPYNYAEVLHKSFIFYYQQRSGRLPYQVCLPTWRSTAFCISPTWMTSLHPQSHASLFRLACLLDLGATLTHCTSHVSSEPQLQASGFLLEAVPGPQIKVPSCMLQLLLIQVCCQTF